MPTLLLTVNTAMVAARQERHQVRCREDDPAIRTVPPGIEVACHLAE
jgi:hypothetical protein